MVISPTSRVYDTGVKMPLSIHSSLWDIIRQLPDISSRMFRDLAKPTQQRVSWFPLSFPFCDTGLTISLFYGSLPHPFCWWVSGLVSWCVPGDITVLGQHLYNPTFTFCHLLPWRQVMASGHGVRSSRQAMASGHRVRSWRQSSVCVPLGQDVSLQVPLCHCVSLFSQLFYHRGDRKSFSVHAGSLKIE